MGFPVGSVGKESTCNAGDVGLIAGLGRSTILCEWKKIDLLKNESRYKLFCPYTHENKDDRVILTMQTKSPEK